MINNYKTESKYYIAKFKGNKYKAVYCKSKDGKPMSIELPFNKLSGNSPDKIWSAIEKIGDDCTSSGCVLNLSSIKDPFTDGKTKYML